jgi:glycosyltransferase involved in cell wall biosynthesis
MRVALDATPLIGSRTGVGRYVAGLVPALAALNDPPELVLTAFTVRGTGDIPRYPGTTSSSRRVPARALQACWQRWSAPPVEWLSGPADVFHATNFVLPPARRAAGVVTVHDLSFVRHPDTVSAASQRYRDLVPRSVRRAAVVLAPTATTADEVADYYGLDPGRVLPTLLGVDPMWAAATAPEPDWLRRRGLPERYLLFVGNREPRKNLPVLLRAHADLRSSQPDVPPLVLVGPPGWGGANDDTVSGASDGADAVVIAGYLSDADLPRVVAGAVAVVLPSRYEGFGLPALEAMACGVPAVVSDLPVLREVTGGLAKYVPVGDADALATALAAAVDDDGSAAAHNERRAWAGKFSWERCARATLAAYRLALG